MDYGDLKRRLIQVNEEMVNIRDNLMGNNIFEAIKCISNLDDQSLIESFDNEIEMAVSKSVNLPSRFRFNEVYSKNFTDELRKMVIIDSHEIKVRNDNFEKVRFTSKRNYNEVNGTKSYFVDKFKNV
jgi:hypothetical protein